MTERGNSCHRVTIAQLGRFKTGVGTHSNAVLGTVKPNSRFGYHHESVAYVIGELFK